MGKRILIADDDPVLQDVLAIALMLNGYAAQAHGSPEEVISALRTERWALVLLDPPRSTAVEDAASMLTRICQFAGRTPVLLMTGSTKLAEWARSNLKLAGILLKPFDPQPFLDQVAELVNHESTELDQPARVFTLNAKGK